MGCQSSKHEESNEVDLVDDLAPTVLSSLNYSTNSSIDSLRLKDKQSMYSSTRFLKIKSIATMNLQKLSNFEDLMEILDIFEQEVYEKLEGMVQVISELNFSLVETTQPSIMLNLQAEGIRDFMFLQNFVKEIRCFTQDAVTDKRLIEENSEFLNELAPLTVNFYLQLGEVIDFGIGLNKPISRKDLSRFLQTCSDRKIITEWSYTGNMPIPVCLQFSCLKNSRACTFYIFDGEKAENFNRAFAIFDYIGAPLQESVRKCFFRAKSEEAHCRIVIAREKITEVSVEISEVPTEVYFELSKHLDIKAINNEKTGFVKTIIHLDPQGISLGKYTEV